MTIWEIAKGTEGQCVLEEQVYWVSQFVQATAFCLLDESGVFYCFLVFKYDLAT